jgi:superfamily II DNA/RNA helicase
MHLEPIVFIAFLLWLFCQVINFDVPLSLAEYARRLGRAGRAGRPGVGTTLVTPGDSAGVAAVVAVLRAGGQAVPDWLLSVAEGGGSGSGSAGSSREESSDGSEGEEEEQQHRRSSSSSEGRRSRGPPALFSVRGSGKLQLGAYREGGEADQGQQPQDGQQQ